MRGARLAREFWNDPEYADRLEREAAELKERFNRDFWIAGAGVLRAGAGRRRRARWTRSPRTSATCCGAASSTRPGPRRSPRTCSGRACSPAGACARSPTGQGRYNPIGYHVGTVWPFDNSIIAWGLWRYGFREEAGRICRRRWSTRPTTSAGGCRRRSPATTASLTRTGPVPDRVQPAGVVRRHAAAAAADHAGAGAAGRASDHRPGRAVGNGPDGAARHPGTVGAGGRLRARPGLVGVAPVSGPGRSAGGTAGAGGCWRPPRPARIICRPITSSSARVPSRSRKILAS